MTGLYNKGGRNTTSEEVDEIKRLILLINTKNKQVVSDLIIDFINKVANRAYEDGVNKFRDKRQEECDRINIEYH